jgi:sec-independent protein translocase protein TatA
MGLPEILIIFLIILLLFGATQVPKLARSFGRSATEFKKGQREAETPDQADDEQTAGKPAEHLPPDT